ncbi:hypothetical protein J4463_04435 [Candidatus Pacearchaeota archaeon]|nr:hypothetical protein [Candidatus Pacearchaeota archaeon]
MRLNNILKSHSIFLIVFSLFVFSVFSASLVSADLANLSKSQWKAGDHKAFHDGSQVRVRVGDTSSQKNYSVQEIVTKYGTGTQLVQWTTPADGIYHDAKDIKAKFGSFYYSVQAWINFDIDDNWVVNQADISIVEAAIASRSDTCLATYGKTCDLNHDGSINTADGDKIRYFVAGWGGDAEDYWNRIEGPHLVWHIAKDIKVRVTQSNGTVIDTDLQHWIDEVTQGTVTPPQPNPEIDIDIPDPSESTDAYDVVCREHWYDCIEGGCISFEDYNRVELNQEITGLKKGHTYDFNCTYNGNNILAKRITLDDNPIAQPTDPFGINFNSAFAEVTELHQVTSPFEFPYSSGGTGTGIFTPEQVGSDIFRFHLISTGENTAKVLISRESTRTEGCGYPPFSGIGNNPNCNVLANGCSSYWNPIDYRTKKMKTDQNFVVNRFSVSGYSTDTPLYEAFLTCPVYDIQTQSFFGFAGCDHQDVWAWKGLSCTAQEV